MRTPSLLVAFLPLLLVAAAGCGSPFAPLSELDGLRVIGAHAEPAEVSPGDTVTMSALAIDQAGKPIAFDWNLCKLATTLAASSTVNQGCVTAALGDAEVLTPLGSGESVTFQLPVFDVTKLGVPDATLGVSVPIRLTARAPGENPGEPDRVVDGIFKLRVRYPGLPMLCAPNRNPTIAGLSGTAKEDGSITLVATFTPGSAEMYCASTSDQAMPFTIKTEQPTVRWFSTAGRFSSDVTGDGSETTFTVPPDSNPPPSGSPIDIYAFGRDDRGGTSLLAHGVVRLK